VIFYIMRCTGAMDGELQYLHLHLHIHVYTHIRTCVCVHVRMCRVENLWVLGFTSYTIFVSIVGLIRHDVAAAYNLSNDVGRYVSVRGSFCAHEYGACEAL